MTHIMGASNANGVWKKAIFDQYLSNSEMMQDTIIVCPSFRMVPFLMTLSDLKWLIEIFNDTKHRAVSLRQLSFLLIWDPDLTISCNVLSWRFYCTLVSRRTSSILSPLAAMCRTLVNIRWSGEMAWVMTGTTPHSCYDTPSGHCSWWLDSTAEPPKIGRRLIHERMLHAPNVTCVPRLRRRRRLTTLAAITVAIATVMAASVYQTRSYHHHPT